MGAHALYRAAARSLGLYTSSPLSTNPLSSYLSFFFLLVLLVLSFLKLGAFPEGTQQFETKKAVTAFMGLAALSGIFWSRDLLSVLHKNQRKEKKSPHIYQRNKKENAPPGRRRIRLTSKKAKQN